jgi:hypothetical protein
VSLSEGHEVGDVLVEWRIALTDEQPRVRPEEPRVAPGGVGSPIWCEYVPSPSSFTISASGTVRVTTRSDASTSSGSKIDVTVTS